jgi:hypothetical protein
MIGADWIWHLLVLACVVWYSTITIYVTIRGFRDIKEMLDRLASQREPANPEAATDRS